MGEIQEWPEGELTLSELRLVVKIAAEMEDINEDDPLLESAARKMEAHVERVDDANQPVKTDYFREELIQLCEDAVRPQTVWHDQNSESAQRNIANAWVLLKAGCDFEIEIKSDEGRLKTNHDTIWVKITDIEGFMYCETCEEDDLKEDSFYIPTRRRLEKSGDRDWY